MSRLNLKQGFNRIFIVLTVIWILTVFVWPFFARSKGAREARGLNYMVYEMCMKSITEYPIPENKVEYCREQREQLDQATSAEWWPKDKNVYQIMFENDSVFLTVATLLVVPPALTYGIIFGLVKLSFWMRQGFKLKGDS